MSPARRKIMTFLLLSGLPNAISGQGTERRTAQTERIPFLQQEQVQAQLQQLHVQHQQLHTEHQRLQVLEQRLQVQKQQLEEQQKQVTVLTEIKDQQQQLVTAVKDLKGQQKSSSNEDRFWQVLPSLITALMALFLGLVALNFNHWSTRRTARQDHIRMLMDVDTRLIERPWLWAIYGHHLTATEGQEEKLNELMVATNEYRTLQEDAMLYSCFNMFEAVFDFHRHLGFFGWRRVPRGVVSALMFWSDRRKADKEYKESWDRFARDFFSDKDGRRSWDIFNRQKLLYSESFQKWVDTFKPSKVSETPPVPPPIRPRAVESEQNPTTD